MKILYIATVGGFMPFLKLLVKELIDSGNTVDFAANQTASKVPEYFKEWGCKIFDISCSRSPFSLGNIKAIREIKELARNYDIVHCHTPLAGMATRFACIKLRKKQNLKVIYTAHGFHFYRGAPIKNWIIFYPVEKICSKWTDVLITINKEDYVLANRKMKAKQIEYIPGVGIDINKFKNVVVNKEAKRRELNIPANAKVILSVGELNQNKNHQIVIKALRESKNSNFHYVIAGVGNQKEKLESLANQLNVNLHLLGYRRDVDELYKIADLYVLPSLREGLNVSIMEAIAAGCPTIASKIRGNVDLVPLDNCFNPNSEKEITSLFAKQNIENYKIDEVDYHKVNPRFIGIYSSIIED